MPDGSQVFTDFICTNPFNLPVRQAGLRLSAFYLLIIISSLFLNYCSSGLSSIYGYDYPLTTETAKSKTSQLSVKIPQGWFTADDNETYLIDLWLIKDDYSATLNFIALNFEPLSRTGMLSDELTFAVQLSKDFKIAKYGKSLKGFTKEERFDLNKKQFAAYQYVDGSQRNIRVVVFKYGSKFYEVSAVAFKTENLSELFKIQNSVLFSIN